MQHKREWSDQSSCSFPLVCTSLSLSSSVSSVSSAAVRQCTTATTVTMFSGRMGKLVICSEFGGSIQDKLEGTYCNRVVLETISQEISVYMWGVLVDRCMMCRLFMVTNLNCQDRQIQSEQKLELCKKKLVM